MSKRFASIFILLPFILHSLIASAEEIKDIKLKSGYGREIVALLAKSMEKQDTTTSRQEQKTVVRNSDLAQVLDQIGLPFVSSSKCLKRQRNYQIELQTRDEADEKRKNVTFTFYGRGFFFWNLGIKTKIKLRARFYLQKQLDSGLLVRSEKMSTQSFLEIKVKNPSPEELGSVNKFRIKIDDRDLNALFSMDAQAIDYSRKLQTLEKKLIEKEDSHLKKTLVAGIFSTIRELSLRNKGFIQPLIAVSYERDAVKFVEPKYLIYMNILKRKTIRNLEYQITMDRKVKGFLVDRKLLSGAKNFIDYFQNSDRDCVCTYPEDSVVVEVKIPRVITHLKNKRRSPIHLHFLSSFVDPLFNLDRLYPGFRLNKGKAGHIKRIIRSNSEVGFKPVG